MYQAGWEWVVRPERGAVDRFFGGRDVYDLEAACRIYEGFDDEEDVVLCRVDGGGRDFRVLRALCQRLPEISSEAYILRRGGPRRRALWS